MVWTAFILGLLGSIHCIGMCGPIAFMLPVERKSKPKGALQLLVYHFGRISTYALIGTAFGFLGSRMRLFGLQQTLSIVIGIAMVLAVVAPWLFAKITPFKRQGYAMVSWLKNALGAQFKRKTIDMFFLVGLLNGLLPCGLVYIAVFGSLAMESALQGAFYMAFFGMGTMPLMSLAVYAGSLLKGNWRSFATKAIPYAVVVIGLLFVLRGLGLGIKYISPDEAVSHPKVSAGHECHGNEISE